MEAVAFKSRSLFETYNSPLHTMAMPPFPVGPTVQLRALDRLRSWSDGTAIPVAVPMTAPAITSVGK